jgi:hypothetical protein
MFLCRGRHDLDLVEHDPRSQMAWAEHFTRE